MNRAVIRVEGLKTYLGANQHPIKAVDDIGFHIDAGETLALLGESGCGKSMSALSIMRLLPASARILQGQVVFLGENLLAMSETQMRSVRGSGISMIFQEPMTSLNPVLRVGDQIIESVCAHQGLKPKEARIKAIELLESVGIPNPSTRIDEYPHQLSGGMKQRVMIAVALANEPELLIADEPTTALDVTIQAQVLDLIRDQQNRRGMGVMLITHDLGVVAQMADRVAVMYAGQIIEQASREQFFTAARHPYSQKLFDSLPSISKRAQVLEVIEGTVPSLSTDFKGCRFASRCDRIMERCYEEDPIDISIEAESVRCHLYTDGPDSLHSSKFERAAKPIPDLVEKAETVDQPLLNVSGLKVHFPIRKGIFKRTAGYVYAVDGVDIQIPQGRTLALVGESGCGKTSVGKGVLQLIPPVGGEVKFQGSELTLLSSSKLRAHRKDFQFIFQDPNASMNPRMLVGDIIKEGMQALGLGDANAQEKRMRELLQQVGLPENSALRYPHEFSGGQRQRICIARALAVDPKLIICDEPTSALDVSVQAQILNLLKQLQNDLQVSYLFITHNISVVAYLAHEVAVMYLGKIVERGPVENIIQSPQHPYTRALLSAVPKIDGHDQNIIHLEGDLPSPSHPPSGCYFHPRCPQAMDQCKESYPVVSEVDQNHEVNCHLF